MCYTATPLHWSSKEKYAFLAVYAVLIVSNGTLRTISIIQSTVKMYRSSIHSRGVCMLVPYVCMCVCMCDSHDLQDHVDEIPFHQGFAVAARFRSLRYVLCALFSSCVNGRKKLSFFFVNKFSSAHWATPT